MERTSRQGQGNHPKAHQIAYTLRFSASGTEAPVVEDKNPHGRIHPQAQGSNLLEKKMSNWTKPTPEEAKRRAVKSVATRKANIAIRKAMEQDAYERRYLLKDEIEQLEQRLFHLKNVEKFHKITFDLSNNRLFMQEEIVAASTNWDPISGVYFLIKDQKVVYVGQSVNVYSRITQHANKKFEKFAVIPCAKESLDVLESLYIHLFKPELNGSRYGNCAPMTMEKLMSSIAKSI